MYCIHGTTEFLGSSPSPPCASCQEIERRIKAKQQIDMADLRAENARLQSLVHQTADILEEWLKYMSEQDKKIHVLKTAMLRATGKS